MIAALTSRNFKCKQEEGATNGGAKLNVCLNGDRKVSSGSEKGKTGSSSTLEKLLKSFCVYTLLFSLFRILARFLYSIAQLPPEITLALSLFHSAVLKHALSL